MSEYRLTKKVDNEKVETEVPVVKETPVQETPATDAPVEQDEPAKDDDDTLKIMRETIDHYMAYKKGLNRLGVADMHGLMELLAAKSNNGPEEGSKTYQK